MAAHLALTADPDCGLVDDPEEPGKEQEVPLPNSTKKAEPFAS
jgi:hypothetical protein